MASTSNENNRMNGNQSPHRSWEEFLGIKDFNSIEETIETKSQSVEDQNNKKTTNSENILANISQLVYSDIFDINPKWAEFHLVKCNECRRFFKPQACEHHKKRHENHQKNLYVDRPILTPVQDSSKNGKQTPKQKKQNKKLQQSNADTSKSNLKTENSNSKSNTVDSRLAVKAGPGDGPLTSEKNEFENSYVYVPTTSPSTNSVEKALTPLRCNGSGMNLIPSQEINKSDVKMETEPDGSICKAPKQVYDRQPSSSLSKIHRPNGTANRFNGNLSNEKKATVIPENDLSCSSVSNELHVDEEFFCKPNKWTKLREGSEKLSKHIKRRGLKHFKKRDVMYCQKNINYEKLKLQLNSGIYEHCQPKVKFEASGIKKALTDFCKPSKRIPPKFWTQAGVQESAISMLKVPGDKKCPIETVIPCNLLKVESQNKQQLSKCRPLENNRPGVLNTSISDTDESSANKSWNKITFPYPSRSSFLPFGLKRAESGLVLMNNRYDKLRELFSISEKEEFDKRMALSNADLTSSDAPKVNGYLEGSSFNLSNNMDLSASITETDTVQYQCNGHDSADAGSSTEFHSLENPQDNIDMGKNGTTQFSDISDTSDGEEQVDVSRKNKPAEQFRETIDPTQPSIKVAYIGYGGSNYYVSSFELNQRNKYLENFQNGLFLDHITSNSPSSSPAINCSSVESKSTDPPDSGYSTQFDSSENHVDTDMVDETTPDDNSDICCGSERRGKHHHRVSQEQYLETNDLSNGYPHFAAMDAHSDCEGKNKRGGSNSALHLRELNPGDTNR